MCETDMLLRVEKLQIVKGSNILINAKDIALDWSERACLIGSSGSGKTISLLAILGLLTQQAPQLRTEIDASWGAVRGKDGPIRIGYVPQGTLGHLNPFVPVLRQVLDIASASRRISVCRSLEEEADKLFAELRLPSHQRLARAFPHELSGGMCQRILLAAALLTHPHLLALDEPTTGLDGVTRAAIYRRILEEVERRGCALLVLTHSASEARVLGKRLWGIHDKQIVPVSTNEEEAILVRQEESGRDGPESAMDSTPSDEKQDHEGEPVFTVTDLRVMPGLAKREDAFVVGDFSCCLKRGMPLGVVGETGAGKTTLVRALSRLIPVSKGQIVFCGENLTDVNGHHLRHLRARFQATFQDASQSLNPAMTVRELLREPSRIHGFASPSSDELRGFVADLSLPLNVLDAKPGSLSYGQRQRIATGRTLLAFPDLRVLLMDEPITGLDSESRQTFCKLIQTRRKDLAILIASHDLGLISHLCEQIVILWKGHVVEAIHRRPWNFIHPYSRLLWRSGFQKDRDDLVEIATSESHLSELGPNAVCPFCQDTSPPHAGAYRLHTTVQGNLVACLRWHPSGP